MRALHVSIPNGHPKPFSLVRSHVLSVIEEGFNPQRASQAI